MGSYRQTTTVAGKLSPEGDQAPRATTMKLDPTEIRYLSTDEFRVLTAVEMGSKNHEVVPTPLIANISGLRTGGANKCIGELAKRNLIAKVIGIKYDGYRLTYGGYDFLAMRTFAKRGTVYGVGNQIGTGKESDIYVVANEEEEKMALKIHRLGRISFRTIKSKRDYLRKGQNASWMYMSRLAAMKEYAFMKILYEHGFPVPKPVDQARHCLVMELIDAFPLRQIAHIGNPGALYSDLMDLIVRLARSGLIHGDFNEFNILVRELPGGGDDDAQGEDGKPQGEEAQEQTRQEFHEERLNPPEASGSSSVSSSADPTTAATTTITNNNIPTSNTTAEIEQETEDGGLRVTNVEPILIDFPQMVSTDHENAEYYFNRDVECIRTFFRKRFRYESKVYPKFTNVMREGKKDFDLDVIVAASGFSKKDNDALEKYMQLVADEEEEVSEEDDRSEDGEGDEEEVDGEDDAAEEDHETLSSTSDIDGALGKARLDEEEEVSEEDDRSEDDEEENVDDEEEEEESDEDEPRRNRKPRAKAAAKLRPAPVQEERDVKAIVTSSLNQKDRQARRHNGKRPGATAGRAKGSKKKSDPRAKIKDSMQF